MAKELLYKTEEVVTLDNDDDEHTSEITYAVVTADTVGQEVVLRNGDSHALKLGEVVVKEHNALDVYTNKEWLDMWADEDRVTEGPSHKGKKPAAKKAAASSGSGS